MNTEKLYEFLVLSHSLNYSSAAETLYISQSVLSKHIMDMEKELGQPLFIRNTHGVSLTPAGELLAGEAPKLIEKCNHAVNLVQIQNLPIEGTLQIACAIELAYASHIQIFMGRFMEHYPNIDVRFQIISDGTPSELLSKYDFVFTPCEYQQLPEDIEVALLQSHGTYAALYPGHPLLSKSLLQIRELAGETIIVPFANELFGPYAKNWLLVKKYTHDQVNYIPAPNLATALFMVSIGKGIAIIPRYVKNMIPGNIFMVGLSNQSVHFNEYFYYHKDGGNNGAAKLFLEEFRSTYPKF
ncbi:MAG: LysR family transcriptional regulator [Lachnospiraceae bacterium]